MGFPENEGYEMTLQDLRRSDKVLGILSLEVRSGGGKHETGNDRHACIE